MKRNIAFHLCSADSAFSFFEGCVNRALEKYAADVAEAKTVYREDVFKEKKEQLASSAHAIIRGYASDLAKEVTETGKKLHKVIDSCIAAVPPTDLISTLRDMKTFGVKLSKPELASFIKAADGNITALRYIGAVANESGFTVDIPDINALSEQAERMERFDADAAMTYIPSAHTIEHGEIFGGSYTNRLYNAQGYKSIRTSMKPGADNPWMKIEDATLIEIKDDPAAYGHSRGKIQAEANERARNIAQMYIDGAPGTGGA